MNPDSKEQPIGHNLLIDFDRTVELIRQIEGDGWYRSTIKEIQAIVSRLKEYESLPENSRPPSDEVFDIFYGGGGVV